MIFLIGLIKSKATSSLSPRDCKSLFFRYNGLHIRSTVNELTFSLSLPSMVQWTQVGRAIQVGLTQVRTVHQVTRCFVYTMYRISKSIYKTKSYTFFQNKYSQTHAKCSRNTLVFINVLGSPKDDKKVKRLGAIQNTSDSLWVTWRLKKVFISWFEFLLKSFVTIQIICGVGNLTSCILNVLIL